MLRRHFLRALFLPFLTTRAEAHTASRRTVLLQESPVAGFQYHQGERAWLLMREGDALRLVREPGNAYDERAVEVYWRRYKLGYVPRVENAAIAQMLDRGERLSARITRLREAHNPWARVRFGVRIEV